MLDIRFIRDNKELVKAAAKKRGLDFEVQELLSLDDERRKRQEEVERLRAEQNQASKVVSTLTDPQVRQERIEEIQELKSTLQSAEEDLKQLIHRWQELMLLVPNIPDVSVPVGHGEESNKELKQWGEKPEFTFPPKDHMELMTALNMVDFERGAKVHGFRGYFLKNDGALLTVALWNYARDFYLRKGFEFFLTPAIVKKEFFYGTGHLPSGAEDLFVTQDDDYLSGTAEVPLMAYFSNEIIDKNGLPKRFLAFSPCFRREAGSYGKDTKGLMRVHEFYKLEQLILCEANHELSVKFHEELNRNMEEFIESLGLPYRQVVLSTVELKGSQVKCYDTELWIPSIKNFREIGSASYYHDFQSRRFNTRYIDNDGKKKYVHSLNATALPTPRILIALLENNQRSDGSVLIPKVLHSYLGKEVLSKAL
ncbi:MAG: seryl-tRNA synthetase [Parcubacteria group bacterium Gr01-1014_107]|nr:MAG: seryl-tRNA synthetase [Parcubacteria group bacterium Gr01-1014_107]